MKKVFFNQPDVCFGFTVFGAPESNKVFGIFVKASLERSCFPS